MLHAVHVAGSRLRHSALLERQQWLWKTIEPAWERVFATMTRRSGFVTHINGDVFRLVYDVGARYERADRHAYEPLVYRPWVDAISSGSVVMDVGAHFGFFSLAAAARVAPAGRVYAFEPAPDTLRILREHVRLNHLEDRMIVVPQVVTDAEGEATFFTEGSSMAASLAYSNVKNSPRHPEVVDECIVPATTVDSFCRARRVRPDLLKIDVEGAELLVLRGAINTLRDVRPRILCEIHPRQMASLGHTVEEVEALLASVDYAVSRIAAPEPEGIFHAWLDSRN